MGRWTAFAHAGDYPFDDERLSTHWARLHAGDAEPLPQDPAVRQAWIHFHSGEFEAAARMGLSAGGAGITVAHKATCIHANALESDDKAKLDLLLEVASRAELQALREPANPNAWFWYAYALGRYSQRISIAKALAQGLASKVKDALERTIALQPLHADAYITLGAFHAEVIDKVGALIGGMTYGAKKDIGLTMYREALRLNPRSPIALIEYGNGLVMLEGEGKLAQAQALYAQAAAVEPIDAGERLDVELARRKLAA